MSFCLLSYEQQHLHRASHASSLQSSDLLSCKLSCNCKSQVGFMVVDSLARSAGIDMRKLEKSAAVGRGELQGRKVILAKPVTFMNNSGESVAALARFYKVGAAPGCSARGGSTAAACLHSHAQVCTEQQQGVSGSTRAVLQGGFKYGVLCARLQRCRGGTAAACLHSHSQGCMNNSGESAAAPRGCNTTCSGTMHSICMSAFFWPEM
jgi:hypothetical protein